MELMSSWNALGDAICKSFSSRSPCEDFLESPFSGVVMISWTPGAGVTAFWCQNRRRFGVAFPGDLAAGFSGFSGVLRFRGELRSWRVLLAGDTHGSLSTRRLLGVGRLVLGGGGR